MFWKDFGYEGKPDTCLWCGKRLNFIKVVSEKIRARLLSEGVPSWDAQRRSLVRAKKRGPYVDGFFCTMSCGYHFGVRAAELEFRLQTTNPGH